MDSALIYNPEFGTEDSVDEQIIFAYGQSRESQLTQLGVAQGVVELARTFDGHPVSWLKTATHLVIVRQLEATSQKNWRHGYWFACNLRIDENVALPHPESLGQIVVEAYRRWALHNGPLATADREKLQRWWHAFCENWTGVNDTGAAGVYPYIRVQPGLLSPSAVQAIAEVKREMGAQEVLVTTYDSADFIWSGSKLSHDAKLALQLWLAECAIAEDTAYAEESGYVYHLRRGFSETRPKELPLEPPPSEQAQPPAETSWFSMPTLSLPTMPSLSLPALSGLPALPAIPSLLSSFSTELPPTVEYPETGFVPAAPLYVDGRKVHLAIYRRKMYVYTLLYESPPKLDASAQRSLNEFAEQLEGFEFAAAPPSSFDYLVIDHAQKTVHSNLPPDRGLHDNIGSTLRDAAQRPRQKEQISRTTHNWWAYYLRLDEETEAVFCNRWSPLDTKSLFGPLHNDSERWLATYMPNLKRPQVQPQEPQLSKPQDDSV